MKQSKFMEWAKTQAGAEFNLAASGVASYPMEKLNIGAAGFSFNVPPGYGYTPLIAALAEKCGVSDHCVVTTVGTSFANHLAMAAILNPGDEVLIEHPAYEPMVATAEYVTRCKAKRFRRHVESQFELDLDDLRKNITSNTRLIVLTNLHNPSSAFVGEISLRTLQELAAGIGARVLVDEIYLEVRRVLAAPVRSSIHLGKEFVVTSSLTKAYGLSALRCGWILAEPELSRSMWRLLDLFYATAPHLDERMSVVALQHLDRIAADVRPVLLRNRALVDEFLDSRDDLEAVRPEHGTVVFPRLRQGSVSEFCALLRNKYETTVAPGSFFEMPDHFRLGFGGDTGLLSKGLERLAAALDDFKRGTR